MERPTHGPHAQVFGVGEQRRADTTRLECRVDCEQAEMGGHTVTRDMDAAHELTVAFGQHLIVPSGSVMAAVTIAASVR